MVNFFCHLKDDGAIADESIEFIERHQNEWWMLTMSLSPPHEPWVVPEPYYSEIAKPLRKKMQIKGKRRDSNQISVPVGGEVGDEGIRAYMANYMAQVAMMDRLIGRVLARLESLSLRKETLVIFASDHGEMFGLHHNVVKINHPLFK